MSDALGGQRAFKQSTRSNTSMCQYMGVRGSMWVWRLAELGSWDGSEGDTVFSNLNIDEVEEMLIS